MGKKGQLHILAALILEKYPTLPLDMGLFSNKYFHSRFVQEWRYHMCRMERRTDKLPEGRKDMYLVKRTGPLNAVLKFQGINSII
jgi:hypothetical protein